MKRTLKVTCVETVTLTDSLAESGGRAFSDFIMDKLENNKRMVIENYDPGHEAEKKFEADSVVNI